MKAFLHIGIEKTGSTSIQEFLKTNLQLLDEASTSYYFGPGLRNSRELAVYCMLADNKDDFTAQAFSASGLTRRQWRESFLKRFQKDMKALKASTNQVIFSSEHFHSRLTTHEEVEALKSLLEPWFKEIEIIVYLRRQDKVAVSLFSTMCRNGGRRQTIFKSRTGPDDEYYNYLGLLERWRHVFGEETLNIRVFDPNEFEGGSLPSDFVHALGLEQVGEFVTPPALNEKLSAPVQNALLLINQYLSGEAYAPLRKEFVQSVADRYPGPERLPTRVEAEAFYESFRESNTAAASKFLGRELLFEEDFSNYPEESGDVDMPDGLVKILVEFIARPMKAAGKERKPIRLNQDRGGILKDLAFSYMNEQPQLAMVLLEEALRHRPKGAQILQTIEKLGDKLSTKAG